LESVLAQSNIENAEVIVYDCGIAGLESLKAGEHPSVILKQIGPGLSFGSLRAQAVHDSKSPIIAFLEEHVRVEKGWLEAVIEAHNNGAAVVGGEVLNGNPGQGISDMVYLMNFMAFIPPATQPGPTKLVVGHNSSFLKKPLLNYENDLPDLFLCDNIFQSRLYKDGYSIILEPAARIRHINETKLRQIIRGYFFWNVLFGYSRTSFLGWSRLKRIIYILVLPMTPFVRLIKFIIRGFKKNKSVGWFILRNSHVVLISQTAAACGLIFGYLFGQRDIGKRFLSYEINAPR
jgi:hypothetical protein